MYDISLAGLVFDVWFRLEVSTYPEIQHKCGSGAWSLVGTDREGYVYSLSVGELGVWHRMEIPYSSIDRAVDGAWFWDVCAREEGQFVYSFSGG